VFIKNKEKEMNLRNLFRVIAVILMLSGFAWLVAPQAGTTVEDLDSYGLYIVQQLGASTVALAVLFFLVSGMAYSPARQAVVTTVILQQLLSGIVHLVAVLGGVIPSGLGWFGVVFSILFVLAFGYFRFIRAEASVTPGSQS
jgi:hypothetical protein